MLLQERSAARRAKWEIFKTDNLIEVIKKAAELGWADKKVQVRGIQTGSVTWEYSIEPFEKDCNCPSILKYADYKRVEETLPLVRE